MSFVEIAAELVKFPYCIPRDKIGDLDPWYVKHVLMAQQETSDQKKQQMMGLWMAAALGT